MSPEYLHDKVLASPDELILCVNYCLKEPEILKNKDYQVKALSRTGTLKWISGPSAKLSEPKK